MRSKALSRRPTIALVAGVLVLLGGWAFAAQDKYSVEVPGGLAFSEFRGYEDWQLVSVSQAGEVMTRDSGQSHDNRGLQGGRTRQR